MLPLSSGGLLGSLLGSLPGVPELPISEVLSSQVFFELSKMEMRLLLQRPLGRCCHIPDCIE